jgi:protoporphyrinogen oxidase
VVRIGILLENNVGVQLAGNAYQGVGIPDCIRSGELAAAAAVK